MTGLDSYSPLVQFKGFLNSPAEAIKSVCYGLAADSSLVAPLHQSQGEATKGYMAVVCSVVLLLFHRGPPAILGLITKRVVDAINGMFARRTRSHIFQKEPVVFPAVTNGTCLIVSMRKISPNPISAGFAAAARISVYRALFIFLHYLGGVISLFLEARSVQILRQTAARSRVAKNKAVRWCGNYISAIASALPRAVMLSIHPKTANGCQAGKLLSYQIFGASHDRY